MQDLTAAIMVDTAVTTTAWVNTVAIIPEQAFIGAATTMQESGTKVIMTFAITADTAITTLTIGVSGMAVGMLTASARAGVGRTPTMNSFGSATETG